MELITDLRAIRKEIGPRLEESSLYPKLNLDAYKDVTPILIKKGRMDYALLPLNTSGRTGVMPWESRTCSGSARDTGSTSHDEPA